MSGKARLSAQLMAHYVVSGASTPSPYVKYSSVRASPLPCTASIREARSHPPPRRLAGIAGAG
jgi:hypothetical protein